jgi:hypothetical protein
VRASECDPCQYGYSVDEKSFQFQTKDWISPNIPTTFPIYQAYALPSLPTHQVVYQVRGSLYLWSSNSQNPIKIPLPLQELQLSWTNWVVHIGYLVIRSEVDIYFLNLKQVRNGNGESGMYWSTQSVNYLPHPILLSSHDRIFVTSLGKNVVDECVFFPFGVNIQLCLRMIVSIKRFRSKTFYCALFLCANISLYKYKLVMEKETKTTPLIVLWDKCVQDYYSRDDAYIPECWLFPEDSAGNAFCRTHTPSEICEKLDSDSAALDWAEEDIVSFLRKKFHRATLLNVNARGPWPTLQARYKGVPVHILVLDPGNGYHMQMRYFAVPVNEWQKAFPDEKEWTKEHHKQLWSKYLGGYPFNHNNEKTDTRFWDDFEFSDASLLFQTVQPDQVNLVMVIKYAYSPSPQKDQL